MPKARYSFKSPTSLYRLPTVFFLILCLFSCTKKESLAVDNESQCVVDLSLAEQELLNLPLVLQHHLSNARGSGAVKGYAPGCLPFTYVSGDSLDFDPALTYTLDASLIACSANDGKQRAGQIRLKMDGRFQGQGTRCQIELVNYSAGEIKYAADSILLENVVESGSYTKFRLRFWKARCMQAEDQYELSADKTIALYPGGKEGPYITFYGTASAQNRNGENYKAEVLNDVYKRYHCAYFSAGTVFVQPDQFKSREIDYGNGDCDEKAEFTVNENKVAFKLK